MWIENNDRNAESLIGISVFSDNTTTTLKCMLLVANPVHANLEKFFARTWQRLIDNGHTLVRLLSVRCTLIALQEEKNAKDEEMSVYGFTSSMNMPLKRDVQANADSERRERRMTVLHKTMKVIVGPLEKCEPRSFFYEPKSKLNGNAFHY